MKNTKETRLSKHDRTSTHINSQRLWRHSQGLHMSQPDVLALRGKWTQALIPNLEAVLCIYTTVSDFVFIGYFCMCMQVSTYMCVSCAFSLTLLFCLFVCLFSPIHVCLFLFNISLFPQMPVCFLISKSKKGCQFEYVEGRIWELWAGEPLDYMYKKYLQ